MNEFAYEVLLNNKKHYSKSQAKCNALALANNMPKRVVRLIYVSNEPLHLVSINGDIIQTRSDKETMDLVIKSKLTGGHAHPVSVVTEATFLGGLIND